MKVRNSLGVTIAIPRNGFRTSKSSSPVTSMSALPQTPSSRNLLSFGSRHSLICSVMPTSSDSFRRATKNRIRSCSVKYLLSLSRARTTASSSKTGGRDYDFTVVKRFIKGFSWNRIRKQQRTYNNICVQYNVQITRPLELNPEARMSALSLAHARRFRPLFSSKK